MVVIMGINLGIINGNLKDGTGIKFKLHKAQGDIKLYLKNGNEVWVHTDVRVRFGGSYDRDMKLLSM